MGLLGPIKGKWPVVLDLRSEHGAIVVLPVGCSTGRVQAYRVKPNNNTTLCETMLAQVTKSGGKVDTCT